MDFFGIFTENVILIRDQSSYDSTLPKESELNCRAVATLLKAVSCFLQLSRGLKLRNRLEKLLLNSPGLLDSSSSSFESLVRLD